MKVWLLVCVVLVLLCLTSAQKKRKLKKDGKKALKKAQSENAAKDSDIEANLERLWEKVNSLTGGVQIHVHGLDDAEPHMQENSQGTHVHLHMHLDRDGDYHHMDYKIGDHGSNDTEYHYAVCNVQPNSALPSLLQQPIEGNIFFRQKGEGHLEIKVKVKGFDMSGDHSSHVHGLHVHQYGDMSDGCQKLGGHFNPDGNDHGGPHSKTRHCGDYGNIECDADGFSTRNFVDDHTGLEGHYSILGRSLVIHEWADELSAETDQSGGAGARLACCVVVGVAEFDWDSLLPDLDVEGHDHMDMVDGDNHHGHGGGHHSSHNKHRGGHHGHGDNHDHGDHHRDHHDHSLDADHLDGETSEDHEAHIRNEHPDHDEHEHGHHSRDHHGHKGHDHMDHGHDHEGHHDHTKDAEHIENETSEEHDAHIQKEHPDHDHEHHQHDHQDRPVKKNKGKKDKKRKRKS